MMTRQIPSETANKKTTQVASKNTKPENCDQELEVRKNMDEAARYVIEGLNLRVDSN